MDDFAQAAPSWDDLVAGFQLGLYGPPILCAIVAGAVLGYLGVFVVLRRMVFITAAVSQAAGLGVALAFYAAIHLSLEINPVVGAMGAALLATALLTLPAERLKISQESLLGLAYLACWAGAVLVGDRIVQESHDIASILFGTAVLVRDIDLYFVIGAAALVLLTHLAMYRGFVFATFDPESARVQGLPVRVLDLVSWVLVAVTVSVATRALGVLPVFALAVLPAMTALVLVKRLRWALPLATAFGALAGALGYLFAFFYELPVGASQAFIALLFFVVAAPVRLARAPRFA